jgi:hypothetical protein
VTACLHCSGTRFEPTPQARYIDDPRFPSGIAIFGSDDSEGEYNMLTFDERGVSRKYEVTLRDNIWKWQPNVALFGRRISPGTMWRG